MGQGEQPTEQQRHGNDDEKVAHIHARSVGTEEDGHEGKDGDERGPKQRHGGLPANRGERLGAWLAPAQVDEYAIYDDDGIIDQHAHGKDERSQGHTLQRAIETVKNEKRAEDDDRQ